MKLIKLLLALIVLGGIAFAVWYFFFPEEEIPFITRTYPKELGALREDTGVENHKLGFSVINANHRADLFFMQGYSHSRKQGKNLEMLRRLFKGERAEGLPSDLKDLAELFYYLDLTEVAKACKTRYAGDLQVILSSYADGLSQGRPNQEETAPWTVEDVLLMQRGYAFLMGRNLVKEWAIYRLVGRFGAELVGRATDFPVDDFGALTQGLQLNPNLDALMGKPLLETVRLFNPNEPLATQVRTHPFLTFVFEPTILELNGGFTAKGLAMIGQPFLVSGFNGNLTYYRQTLLANDEQMYTVPTAVMDREASPYRPNDNAEMAPEYPRPPIRGPRGMRLTTMVKGAKDMELFYYWDGLRPSADLAALYYLLETERVDEALSAYQYHQVPAGELTLMTPSGRSVNMLTYPSDPRQPLDATSLFSGSYTRIGRPMGGVTGIHARSDSHWKRKNVGKIDVSQLDQELIALVRFYLKGPIGDREMEANLQEQLLELFTGDPTTARDYFLQQFWQMFFDLLAEEYLDEASRGALRALPAECKRIVLEVYGRGSRNEDTSVADQADRTRTFANLLTATWHQYMKVVQSEPEFTLANKRGKLKNKTVDIFVRSADAATSWFFVDEGNHISQVATYTLIFDKRFSFWRYEFKKNGSLGKPKRINNPRKTAAMYLVKPKI